MLYITIEIQRLLVNSILCFNFTIISYYPFIKNHNHSKPNRSRTPLTWTVRGEPPEFANRKWAPILV